ncbi:MAG: FecR domain-containing protein [Prolixibacteraceae bacterium]
MKKQLLIKYLNNRCTDKEFDEIVSWIKTEAESNDAKRWSYDQWKSLEPDMKMKDEKKYNALLYKIHYEINLNNRNVEDNTRILPRVKNWLSRVAAILVLPLLGIVSYMLINGNFQVNRYADMTVDSLEIIAPIGSRTVVQLSDGTEVNLNYGSKIKYPRNFGDTREITLSGEGYFDVAHDPSRPFIVKTGKLNVKAVGTEFNVCAYPDDKTIETTLIEGKVVIEKAVQDEKSETVRTMAPGQHLTYDRRSGAVSSTNGNIGKYIAWKDDKLVFDNEPIAKMAEKLGRMFNVEFEIADNVKDFSYTVTFSNDPLGLILDLMEETAPIRYTVLPRKKQPDGTFSKQKIKIEKR